MNHDEAKAYGARRAKDLLEAMEAVIRTYPDLEEVKKLDQAFLHIRDPFLRVVSRQEATRFRDLTDQLAALEHTQWAHWTDHMLSQLKELFDFCAEHHFEPEAAEHIRRWQRQIRSSYAELSESEKESDREWARKILICLEGSDPFQPPMDAAPSP